MHDVPLIPLMGDNVSELLPTPALRSYQATRGISKPGLSQPAIVDDVRQGSFSSTGEQSGSKSVHSASLRSLPSSHTSRHVLTASPSRAPGQPSSDSAHVDLFSPTKFDCNVQDQGRADSAGASSGSFGLAQSRAAHSPSRQQEWQIDSQPSTFADAKLTTRASIDREIEREHFPPLKQAARTAAQHQRNNTTTKNPARKKPIGAARYRPAHHSPHLPPSIAMVRSPQWLPEIPICNDIIRNQHGQCIDAPLPRPTQADHKAIHERAAERGLCNKHHLQNSCQFDKGSESRLPTPQACIYDHGPVSAQVLLALMHLARKMACPAGPTVKISAAFTAINARRPHMLSHTMVSSVGVHSPTS